MSMRRTDRTWRSSAALCATLVLVSTAGLAHAGASIVGPRPVVESRERVSGLNVGFWASNSQPTSKSRDVFDASYKAGGTVTWMRTRSTGFGIGLDYCRWRSSAAGAELDNFFSAFSGTEIRGTEATLSGLRGTLRVTQLLMPDAAISPWVQLGAGICRSKSKIVFPVAQLQYSGWQVSGAGFRTLTYQPILMAGLGIDLRTNAHSRIGFDLIGEMIQVEDEPDPVMALTFGGHVLFGRWPGR